MWNIHRTYILLIVRIPLLAICCYVAADVLEGVICESIPPYESLLVWLHVISLAASLYLNGTFHFVHRGSTKTMLWFIVQRINPLVRKLWYDFPFTGKNGRGLAHHSRLELVSLWSCSLHRLWNPRPTLALHLEARLLILQGVSSVTRTTGIFPKSLEHTLIQEQHLTIICANTSTNVGILSILNVTDSRFSIVWCFSFLEFLLPLVWLIHLLPGTSWPRSHRLSPHHMSIFLAEDRSTSFKWRNLCYPPPHGKTSSWEILWAMIRGECNILSWKCVIRHGFMALGETLYLR